MNYAYVLSILLAAGGVTRYSSQPAAAPSRAQPSTKPATTVTSKGAVMKPAEPAPDFDAVVRALGSPVSFDQVFAEVQSIPRVKDEFETAAQFGERQAAARAKCQERYLIAAPVDSEHVRYDADKQVLVVATYALTNTLATSDELGAVFGYGSELSKAGVEIKYGLIGHNVMWAFPRDQRDVGTYDGANALGVRATITRQEHTARGVFERQGAGDEDVWSDGTQPYVKGSPPVAFEIKADPARAKALKQGGLRDAVLVVPHSPYSATGVNHFNPTLRAPFDRTTTVRYLIGDIQCAALYDSEGKLLAMRATR
jgi:hypothetical protein